MNTSTIQFKIKDEIWIKSSGQVFVLYSSHVSQDDLNKNRQVLSSLKKNISGKTELLNRANRLPSGVSLFRGFNADTLRNDPVLKLQCAELNVRFPDIFRYSIRGEMQRVLFFVSGPFCVVFEVGVDKKSKQKKSNEIGSTTGGIYSGLPETFCKEYLEACEEILGLCVDLNEKITKIELPEKIKKYQPIPYVEHQFDADARNEICRLFEKFLSDEEFDKFISNLDDVFSMLLKVPYSVENLQNIERILPTSDEHTYSLDQLFELCGYRKTSSKQL